MIIQPALAAFFDNTAWIEGKENTKPLYNVNNLLTADESLYHVEDSLSNSFKYRDFADFLMYAPAVTMKDGDKLVYAGDKKVEDVYVDGVSEEDVKRILRTVKPMISMDENGLTVTNVDSVPYPLNMAYVLLVRALLYNPDHITALQKMIEEMREEIGRAHV